MRFTAYAQTGTSDSRRETEFEVDDAELAGLNDEQREEYLHEQAMDAVFGEGLVQVWHEEAGE